MPAAHAFKMTPLITQRVHHVMKCRRRTSEHPRCSFWTGSRFTATRARPQGRTVARPPISTNVQRWRMIRNLQVSRDGAGFPIVAWTEDRGFASPGAHGRARVECRIMKDAAGTLLFVARGTSRHGSFEEGKPWERLHGFSKHNAEALYYTRQQLELHQHFANKKIGTKLALSDGAHVLLAEFDDNVALHINCADATPVEIDRLHVTLIRAFIRSREELVGNICSVAFEWPVGDDNVVTYDPARPGWPDQQKQGILVDALGWIVALGVVAALAALVLWLLGILPR